MYSDKQMEQHDGPFQPWESDHTALVHVLWTAKYNNLDIANNADEIAEIITHSRWLAAHDAALTSPPH